LTGKSESLSSFSWLVPAREIVMLFGAKSADRCCLSLNYCPGRFFFGERERNARLLVSQSRRSRDMEITDGVIWATATTQEFFKSRPPFQTILLGGVVVSGSVAPMACGGAKPRSKK
jgi:hypothetical protein